MSASSHRPSTSSLSHPSTSASASTINRNRQYSHLHAQLAQLNAHLADMENLVGMTAVQAEYVRGLGGWWGGGFMAASKILGEEAANAAGAGAGAGAGEKEKAKQK
ncbi:hypothetical protein HO173_002081 [Letharia columbiana]|uniref:Uncharacterized protein n=1 Tax=Letharia columbiana TaxID=112416 RepID=A0A8H6G2U0_9LECA|nr:uncharacterized protein HO173_002081 [Letharia columbiana]KAF6239537.1 hypothetical protein HO173_002081 [Letharia columbiana]